MFEYLKGFFLRKNKVESIVTGVILVILMVIPFPSIVVQVLMGICLMPCIFYMVWCMAKKPFKLKKKEPEIVLITCLVMFTVDINATRLILTGNQLNGFFIIGKNLIDTPVKGAVAVGFYTILAALMTFFVIKNANCSSEVSARFSLDVYYMSGATFDIENQLCMKKITMQEAEFYKKQVRDEIDFYSTLDASAKFIKRMTYAFILVSVVQLLGGILIAYTIYQKNLETAVTEYCHVVSLTGIFFICLMMIICFSFNVFSLRGAVIRNRFDYELLSDYSYANYSYQFVVSLGEDLLPLVKNKTMNSSILKNMLQELSEESKLPFIYFREDEKFLPTEYVVSWHGKVVRGILDLREGEEMCATAIVETVRKMWEG